MRVLLVDDDAGIRLAFATALQRRGHTVITADTVARALSLAETVQPEVGVIDVMLPDGDGFALCRTIAHRWGFPTVMLTARDDDVDVVGGLEAGADDYVVKPVSPAVLEARLRAVLRRRETAPPNATGADRTKLGQLSLSESAMDVLVDGTPLPLSPTELHLLLELAANPGRALSREQLIDLVWHDTPPSTARVVDTTMQRLRSKLAAAGVETPQLETLRGIGYRLR